MSILSINALALDLVAGDFSYGHAPTNGGPTKTSRALAIIHLAAHDAYAQASGVLTPKLTGGLPPLPGSIPVSQNSGETALIGAGLRACLALYPDEALFIEHASEALRFGRDLATLTYGETVADAWVNARMFDGSDMPLENRKYDQAAGKHRPDPLDPGQAQHGPNWGKVKPFILTNVASDAFLKAPPGLADPAYFSSWLDVKKNGKADLPFRSAKYREHAEIGIFWGYDGSNRLGTPPRMYLQVVRSIVGFKNATSYDQQVRILAACSAAMADAGIAAWHWKYTYNLWRPVLGIREADAGWGPLGLGDANPARAAAKEPGDPFWLPLGAPRSNPHPGPVTGAAGANVTPNFPAYPSGHSTFGSACFGTAAKLLGKTPGLIDVEFTSDEFNGSTRDNTGAARPRWTQKTTLQECIKQNAESRIYLGVHWDFDASGGADVGDAIAAIAGAKF